MKPFQNVMRSVKLLKAATTATTISATIDSKNADYVTIELAVGKAINTDAAPVVVKIQEADGDVDSAFVDINTTTLQKSIALSAAAEQVAAFHVNMNGTRKRYIRLFSTPGTVVSNDAIAMTVIANLKMDLSPVGTVGQADVVAIG